MTIDILPVPLLFPDMPEPLDILPWLERMHASKHYSNFGPLVRELEAQLADKFNVASEQITTVSNATQGLELVLQALNLGPGAHVLVPALTFVATATAVIRAGYVPVFADVDADSWMLTPAVARAACELMRIDAVLPVTTFGMPYDMQEWALFEQETGLPVVVDAAAAYGSQWLKGVQGTLVFSLHATKSLPAGEGGFVVSTRSELAIKVRELSNFGINLNLFSRVPIGALNSFGTNAKMSEYHAAVALAAFQRWTESARKRRILQMNLIEILNSASGGSLKWQEEGSGGRLMAPTLLCAQLPSEKFRDYLEKICANNFISTRRWYQPLLSEMFVIEKKCHVLKTPNAIFLSKTLLGLPFFVDILPSQIKRLVTAVEDAYVNKFAHESR